VRKLQLRIRRRSVNVSNVGAVDRPLNRPRLDRSRSNRRRSAETPQQTGCRPLLFKAVSKLCASFWAIIMSSHNRKARLCLVIMMHVDDSSLQADSLGIRVA